MEPLQFLSILPPVTFIINKRVAICSEALFREISRNGPFLFLFNILIRETIIELCVMPFKGVSNRTLCTAVHEFVSEI
jgi:hypothetical protein